MTLEELSSAILSGSITFASLMIVVLIFTLNRIDERLDLGEPILNYKRFSWILVIAILLGGLASLTSLFFLMNENSLRFTFHPEPELSLIGFSIIIYTLGIVAMGAGVLYIVWVELR